MLKLTEQLLWVLAQDGNRGSASMLKYTCDRRFTVEKQKLSLWKVVIHGEHFSICCHRCEGNARSHILQHTRRLPAVSSTLSKVSLFHFPETVSSILNSDRNDPNIDELFKPVCFTSNIRPVALSGHWVLWPLDQIFMVTKLIIRDRFQWRKEESEQSRSRRRECAFNV